MQEDNIRDDIPDSAAAGPVADPERGLFDAGNHPLPAEFPDDGEGEDLLEADAEAGAEPAPSAVFGDGGVRALTADQLADISDNLQLLALGREDRIGADQMGDLQELLDRCEVDIAHPVHKEIDRIAAEATCTHARLCQAFLRTAVPLNIHVRMPGKPRRPRKS